jgi:para-aminobenzoate synthetase component I
MNRTKSSSLIDEMIYRLDEEELILLESQQSSHPSSKKSFIACRPSASIMGYGTRIVKKVNGETEEFKMDPWEAIGQFQKEADNWLFGYLGYDLKNHIEKISSCNPSLVEAPDFYFMRPEVLICIKNGKVTFLKGDAELHDMKNASHFEGVVMDIKSELAKVEYIQHVEEIKRRIKEGDFYEMNYSYPLQAEFQGDPYWLYSSMRKINPVPFGSFIKTENFSVCCASPERFLKKEGVRVVSEPIKGTSARSSHSEEDRMQRELLLNEKNRAENLMIVDLVRHDLSRVAKTGSVRVSKLFEIQTFGTVHQLISSVEGEVDPETSPIEILKACFPMGSMTGAPKITVMKVIDELETYKRGIYSGAIGYFDPDGNFDFNVVIRSAIIQGEKLVYSVGGAITTDSEPNEEWEETKIKARNLTEIISRESTITK